MRGDSVLLNRTDSIPCGEKGNVMHNICRSLSHKLTVRRLGNWPSPANAFYAFTFRRAEKLPLWLAASAVPVLERLSFQIRIRPLSSVGAKGAESGGHFTQMCKCPRIRRSTWVFVDLNKSTERGVSRGTRKLNRRQITSVMGMTTML